jgi:hypothetical protein
MNCCRETVKMGVPAAIASLLAQARRAGHRATVPRYRGIGPEAYLNDTSQGELVLSLSKEHPRRPGFRLVEKDGY